MSVHPPKALKRPPSRRVIGYRTVISRYSGAGAVRWLLKLDCGHEVTKPRRSDNCTCFECPPE